MTYRFAFARLADASVRLGTFGLVAQAAYSAVRSYDYSPWGLALGGVVLVVYSIYLWRCMNAEHALTLLEKQVGMRVRVKAFGKLSVGFDYPRFIEFAHYVSQELNAQRNRQEAA